MPVQRSSRRTIEETSQRAIVFQLLRNDHDECWTRAQLECEIDDISPLDLSDAIERLRQEGIVHVDGERVWVYRAARHLDRLGMIGL